VLQIVEPKLGHGLAMAHSWLNKITWLSFGSLLAHSWLSVFFRSAEIDCRFIDARNCNGATLASLGTVDNAHRIFSRMVRVIYLNISIDRDALRLFSISTEPIGNGVLAAPPAWALI
jgi:hypothetical protein